MPNEIVVAIDFGTTYSGISWAVNAGAKNIKLITNWPNPTNRLSDQAKVPSVLSYDKNGRVDKWGYKVGPNDSSLKWLKLLLPGAHQYSNDVETVKRSNTMLKTINKTARQVITDYLQCLWEWTREDIRRVKGNDFEKIYELRLVLTVPAMWSDAAKDSTLKAAYAAGLPGSLELVTEPEAAARYVLKAKAEENELKVGDAFVVCDAGGGTVDLISYVIESLNPLRMKECAVGTGGLCGAVFLDINFEKHISMLVGEDTYKKLKPVNIRKMLLEFETVKRSFQRADRTQYTVDLKGIADNPEKGIEDGTISIKTNALRDIFDHVCSQVQHLVEDQIQAVKQNNNLNVKAILLVGGFGSSSYLFDSLEAANRSSRITVLQAPGAWSAVCQGATLWGLENTNRQKFENMVLRGRSISRTQSSRISSTSTVVSRLARYNYGVPCMIPFNPSQHLECDKIWYRPRDMWYADNQIIWLLKRGEVIEDGEVLRTEFGKDVQVTLRDCTLGNVQKLHGELVYCDAKIPPSRLNTDVKSLCTLTCQIPCSKVWSEPSFISPVSKQEWRKIYYQYMIVLGSGMLSFKMQFKKEILGKVDAKYAEDFES